VLDGEPDGDIIRATRSLRTLAKRLQRICRGYPRRKFPPSFFNPRQHNGRNRDSRGSFFFCNTGYQPMPAISGNKTTNNADSTDEERHLLHPCYPRYRWLKIISPAASSSSGTPRSARRSSCPGLPPPAAIRKRCLHCRCCTRHMPAAAPAAPASGPSTQAASDH
jgi:hypothetical protein